MAETVYKGTYFFSAGRYGWSESWYISTTAALGNVVPKFTGLAPLRDQLLAFFCTIDSVRVSLPDDPGTSILETLRTKDVPPTPQPLTRRDQPYNAYLYTVSDEAHAYRKLYQLRGLADQCFGRDGEGFEPELGLTHDAMNAMIAYMKANEFAWRGRQKNEVTAQKTITNVARGGVLGTTLLTIPAHGVEVGQKLVKIHRVRGPVKAYLKGTWRPTIIDDDHITIPLLLPVFADLTYWGGGLMEKTAIFYPRVFRARFQRYCHRDTGRPFDLPRGRRPKRR